MFSRKFIISQVIFLLFLAVLFITIKSHSIAALPVYGTINDFELVNADNSKVTLADLKNKVWVADFIFTTCGGICPTMTKNLALVSQVNQMIKDVLLVSITVNPQTDNPDILKKYATKYQADPTKWLFLTGSEIEIKKILTGSFKLGDIDEPIFHSSYFTLVDRQSRIRGYYDGTDIKQVHKLIKDIKRLRNEK